MSGHVGPIRCCDRECAGVNHCTMGGVECNGCGRYFCSGELDEDGYCDDCSDAKHEDNGEARCDRCEEWFPEEDLEDGLCEECFIEREEERNGVK